MKTGTRYSWTQSTREWGFNLEDAPKVGFGYAGALPPDRATVTERVSSGRRSVTIRLEATTTRHNPTGVTFSGRWGAPEALPGDPADYGHDGHGHINDLPDELVTTILAACDGVTIPVAADPDN